MKLRLSGICVMNLLAVQGCTISLSHMPAGTVAPSVAESPAGLWAGPWEEGEQLRGHMSAVVEATSAGEYEAVIHAVTLQQSWTDPGGFRPAVHADLRVPLSVSSMPQGKLRIQGEARQFHPHVGFFTLVVDGTAEDDEIRIGFTRGNATGRARLRRITTQPLQTTNLVPFLLKAQMDPPQMREEIRQAWEMPLEPDAVPASEPITADSTKASRLPSAD